METLDNTKTVQKPKKKRLLLKIIFAVLILFIVILIAVPLLLPGYISSKSGNKFILEQANKRIDGTVNFENLSMSWAKGIEISGLTFKNKAGNLTSGFQNFKIKPHYLSLLSTPPHLGIATVDRPFIELTIPKLAESKPGEQTKPAAAAKVALPLIDLTINNGGVKVNDQSGKTIELSEINTSVNIRPEGEQSSFDLNANVSADSVKTKFVARGQIKTKKGEGFSFKNATGNLSVDFDDMDLESLGVFLAMAGVDVKTKGNVSAKVAAQITDGKMEKVDFVAKGKNLDVTGPILKGDSLHTNNLDINTKLSQKQDMLNIDSFVITTDWLSAQATGTAPADIQVESLDKFLSSGAELSGNFQLQLATVLNQLPNTLSLKKGMQLSSGLLSVQTAAEAGKKVITAQANLTNLAGTLDGKPIALSQPVTMNAQVGAEGKSIRLDKLNVSSSFANLDCSGTEKEIKFSMDADLSKLQAEAGQFVDFNDYKFAGNLLERGTALIEPEKISFKGNTQIKNLVLGKGKTSASEPLADIQYQMQLNTKENTLAITSLNTTASIGTVNIKDSTVALDKKSDKQTQLNISAKAIDLAKVQPFAMLFTALLKDTKMAGIAQADAVVRMKGETIEFKTDNAKISNLNITGSPEQKPFIQKEIMLVADGKLNQKDYSYTLNGQLKSEQINIKLNLANGIQKDTGILTGKADLDYDWASLTALASPFIPIPQSLKIEGKQKDVITFSSQYPASKPDQMFANLNAKGGLGFDRAQFQGFDAGNTQVNIAGDTGLMKIAPFSTTLNKGTLNFAANLDLKSKPMTLTLPQPVQFVKDFQLNDIIANKLGIFLTPLFQKAANVTGRASFYCDRMIVPIDSKDLKGIDISGTIAIDNLRIQSSDLLGQILTAIGAPGGTEIIIKPVKFTVQNGFVTYKEMEVAIGGTTIYFRNAKIGLDASYDMILDLPVSGERVQVGIKAKPGQQIKLDLKPLLKGLGEKLLKDQLQKIFE